MKKEIAFLFLILTVCSVEKDYTETVLLLKSKIEDRKGQFWHSAYNRLAYISDTYGPRMWGSNTLQMVISEVAKMAYEQGFQNIHLQPVQNFTKWIRGTEQLILHEPRPSPSRLNIIGLGGSVSAHIKGEVLVVTSFQQLEQKKALAKGKIVVLNPQYRGYGETSDFRYYAGKKAENYGAIGALVRSVTPFSISSVHTGNQQISSIPAAAITIEDAQMLQRMQNRGQKIVLQINMQSQSVPNSYSNNLIFQIKGSEKPDQIVLIGGHIDSWDTGSQTGANDDGGGFITCFEAMRLLLKNGLRPRRTIRFIAWSGEEWGGPNNGNKAYLKAHLKELGKHIVAFEDDEGSTRLYGFGYLSDDHQGKKLVREIAFKYLTILNATTINDEGDAADTYPLYENGVPTMTNLIQDQNHDFYYTYHHSAGDTMSIMNADELDSNVVGVAAMFYILADLENTIPRKANGHLRSD